jgi:hypothetical protein
VAASRARLRRLYHVERLMPYRGDMHRFFATKKPCDVRAVFFAPEFKQTV